MSKGKRNQKNTGFDAKTFPVPFPKGGNQENITINTLSKHSKEEIIKRALKSHSEGNITKATEYYQYFISQGFKDPRIFLNYGIILKGLDKFKEAEIFTRKAIELNPDFAEAYYSLANTLKEIGKLKESELSFRKAIDIKPNFSEAYYNLGNILKVLDKLKESELSYRKTIELKPDFAPAHYNLGTVFKDLGKLEDAKSATIKAIELNPNFAEAHLNLGTIYKDLGKLEDAKFATIKAIKLNPNFAEAHFNLGIIFRDSGQLKEAEQSMRRAIELKADYFEAHLNLGEILFELGESEEACISEWKAIKVNPSYKFIKSYQDNGTSINKTAFWIFSKIIFNHYKPIIEINPNLFEILVPESIDKEIIQTIKDELRNNDIKIRSDNELIKNNLFYEQLVSNRADDTYELLEHNKVKLKINVPTIKLLGKKNIKFMYTAGKDGYTIFSYWNKYYDGILCYGPYHEEKLKLRHKISTMQMGYPRFDKYFNPGYEKDYLINKYRCDSNKKTIVWIATWRDLSSTNKYLQSILSLKSDHNIVLRPHPSMKFYDPENYKKLLAADFTYIDDSDEDNVPLYELADLMLFDYGGSMFGSLYLNKNFAFLEMNTEARNNPYLGEKSSEEYLKSFFPDRIATLSNIRTIVTNCLKNPPTNSILKSLREEFFNTNYQGNSSKRAYDLLINNDWLR